MKKFRAIAVIVSILSFVLLLSVTANAETVAEGSCGENLTWVLDDSGTLTISGEGEMADYSSGTAPWKNYLNDITKCVVESGVTRIGAYAFHKCTKLNEILLADTITAIGEYSFYFCSSLTEIVLPDSLVSIEDRVFLACPVSELEIPEKVESIEMPLSLAIKAYKVVPENPYLSSDNGLLYNKDKSKLIDYPCGLTEKTFTVPETVITIGAYAFEYSVLTSVVLSDSVKRIEMHAFNGSDIRTIDFGNSVEHIEFCAFAYTNNLTEVHLPDSVTYIGTQAFYPCHSLTEITLPNSELSLGHMSFSANKLTTVFIPEKVKTIVDNPFMDCNELTEIIVDENNEYYTSVDGVLYDKNQTLIVAYPGGKSGASFNIPGTVQTVGEYSFDGVCFLKEITVPDTVTKLEMRAFSGATTVERIKLSEKLTNIPTGAFSYCSSLKEIELPTDLRSIESQAFYRCISLESFVIPKTVTYIDHSVFEGCSALEEVIILSADCYIVTRNKMIPETAVIKAYEGSTAQAYAEENNLSFIAITQVDYFGDGLFWLLDEDGLLSITGSGNMPEFASSEEVPWKDNKTEIKTIVIGNGISSIGKYAFYQCSALENVDIADTITSIGDNAFSGCALLSTIVMGDNITTVGVNVFMNCSMLSDVTLSESLEALTTDMFAGCISLTEIYIPASIQSVTLSAFDNCTSLTAINVAEENASYYSVDGVLFITESAKLVKYPLAKSGTEYTVPDNTLEIGQNVFNGNTKLNKIVLNEELEKIGSYAFYECNLLEEIYLPASVNSVGSYAFSYCSSLKSITVDLKNEKYCSVDGVLYNKEMTRVTAYPGGKTSETFVIPETVERTNQGAFYGIVYLKNLIVTSNIRSILPNAMYVFNKTSIRNIVFTENVTEIDARTVGNSPIEFVTVLNPDCSISNTFCDEKVNMRGFAGSTAERYTEKNHREFTLLTAAGDFGEGFVWLLEENGLLEIAGSGEMPEFTSASSVPWQANKADIKTAVIGKGVSSIGNYAFYQCSALEAVELSDTVKSIGNFAFFDCESLESINSDNCTDLETLGANVFGGCSSLEKINLPENVSVIGENPFLRCTALKSINVNENNEIYYSVDGVLHEKQGDKIVLVCYPAGKTDVNYTVAENVTAIATGAFAYCDYIEQVDFYMDGALEAIGKAAFYECSALNSFTVPGNLKEIDGNIFVMCLNLENIFVFPTNESFFAFDGVLFDYDMEKIIAYPAGNDRAVYEIPAIVKSIDAEAFCHCPNLKTVVYEEGSELTVISESAFYNCENLSFISLPDTLEVIDAYSFMNCSSLDFIYVPENVSSIGNLAFGGCRTLNGIIILSRECQLGMLYDNIVPATVYAYENASFVPSLILTANVKFLADMPEGAFTYSGGVLTINDISGVVGNEDPLIYPWTRYSGETTAILFNNSGAVASGLFRGFSEASVIIINSDDYILFEENAFAELTKLKTVVSFADTVIEDGAFGGSEEYNLFIEEGKSYEGSCNEKRFSFADGIISFATPELSLNEYDFLELISAICYGYNDSNINMIEFSFLEAVAFAFDVNFKNGEDEDTRTVYENVKLIPQISFDDELYETITFNEFCEIIGSGDLAYLRLAVYNENGENTENEESVMVSFSEIVDYIFRAFITLLDKITDFFKSLF